MKANSILIFLFFMTTVNNCFSQTNPVIDIFPKGTVLYGNIEAFFMPGTSRSFSINPHCSPSHRKS